MLDWLRCVFLRGGHRFGRWWWEGRQDGAGTHRLCEECACESTPSNRHMWSKRSRTTN